MGRIYGYGSWSGDGHGHGHRFIGKNNKVENLIQWISQIQLKQFKKHK